MPTISPTTQTRTGPPLGVMLWILFFCYATVTALVVQKLLLPLMPSLHAGSGLMYNDATLFHTYAVAMAETIKAQGWSAWTLHDYTQPGFSGNVALLAALYALFGIDPSLMVPFTAAAHATGGVLIYLLGRNLWHGPVGKYGGMIAAILFVGFPSALFWYGQPLKDGFSIAGALLILYCWLLALDRPPALRSAILLALGVIVGMALLFFVKPYLLILAFVAALLMFLIMLLMQMAPGTRRSWRLLLCFLPALLLLAGGARMGANTPSTPLGELLQAPGQASHPQSREEFRWVNSDWIPGVLDRYIATAARHRAGYIEFGRSIKAGSMIDVEDRPNNVVQVAAYLPRALQIGLFAPFPSTWPDKISVLRLVGIVETLMWYLAIPGIFFALRKSRHEKGRTQKIVLLFVYALFFLTVLSFVNPNVGTLYRMRYAYLFLLLLMGTLGWTHWFLERRARLQTPPPQQPEQSPAHPKAGSQSSASMMDTSGLDVAANMVDTAPAPQTRAGVATAGLLVIVLTLVSSLGFFLRDLLMARQFGFGDELDVFFIAMMIPMFLVTVLSIPLGTAMTPAFLRARENLSLAAAQALVSRVSLLAVLGLSVLVILLYVLAPLLLPYLALGFSAAKLERALILTYWALPLMVASGAVIIGNALLNAMQNFALPSWAQAVVPVAAITALLIFGNNWGATAVVIGMLLGQMLNLAIVVLALNQRGLSLRPRWTEGLLHRETLRSFTAQYLPLIAAALFVALAIPVGNVLASNLASGSVGALNLGNKIVLFVTGLIGTAIATAILPHFSAYLAMNRRPEVRRELSFFLLTGTALAMPISIVCFLAAKPLALLAFGGGAVNDVDIETVTRVIKFGIIQLPVFTCNILLLRFAAASHQSGRVMLLSLLGLVFNIGLSLLLMGHMGVAGIALATTLALGISTFLMLAILHRLGDVPWVEVVMIALCWILFFTLMLCLHYRSHAGTVIAGLGILLLLVGYWREATGRSRLLQRAVPMTKTSGSIT